MPRLVVPEVQILSSPNHVCTQAGRTRPANPIVTTANVRQVKGRCGTPLRYVSSLGLRPLLDLPGVSCRGLGPLVVGSEHSASWYSAVRPAAIERFVIAKPAADYKVAKNTITLGDLGQSIGVVLTPEEEAAFAALPPIERQPVGSVLVALEAKACATEHKKSESRMFDELNSSQATIYGAADQAVAVGLAVVNFADLFISPGRQGKGEPLVVNEHNQPGATASLIAKLRELPRRSAPGETGFDAFGIMVISLVNDGSPVAVVSDTPAPQPGDQDTYAAMVMRAASLYDYRFSAL